MNEDDFWAIIDEAKRGAADIFERPSALAEILSKKGPTEILAFYECYKDQIDKAYRWELWGAAYIINGGCSDDGFDYFRDWLISEGRAVFEAALVDPETLAGVAVAEETELEEMRYVADTVYETQAGKPMEPRQREYRDNPDGVEWSEDDLESLFPKLAKAYG